MEFIQAYMDDALGPRAWVEDQEGCKAFIDNLSTSWNPALAAAALRGGDTSLLESPIMRDR